ncbi:hypothetical protein CP968_00250 [Streptomyces subrutilus]|uniref:Uncharacterized protein n=1 Tax=Streptomyces subrutilus TaxID=36818 RepID=A0A5P2UK49_9ACTN|nr:hypothetical protein CP968_00250 [Streptomyces subrutilus]
MKTGGKRAASGTTWIDTRSARPTSSSYSAALCGCRIERYVLPGVRTGFSRSLPPGRPEWLPVRGMMRASPMPRAFCNSRARSPDTRWVSAPGGGGFGRAGRWKGRVRRTVG